MSWSASWIVAVLASASVHFLPLTLKGFAPVRAAWCWPSKAPRCPLPEVPGGACLRNETEVLELLPGESCYPSCTNPKGVLAGSCTELRCPPSGPQPSCLEDLQADTWWTPCGYGSQCQNVLELGSPRWRAFGHYSCEPTGAAGSSACESIVEVRLPPKTSSLQSLDMSTAVSFGVLAVLARFSRLISECVSYNWCGGSVARFLYGQLRQWTLVNVLGVLCLAVMCLSLFLLPFPRNSSGIAAGLSALITVSWAFWRAGIHSYVLMRREAAWRIHYICGALTIGITSVHGSLNVAENGIIRVLSNPFWLCGLASLLAMIMAVLPARLLRLPYDRFKQLHFLSVAGYFLALAHMLGHAVQLQTIASVSMATLSASLLCLYGLQKLYVRASMYHVEVRAASVASDGSGKHLFLSLEATGFSFKAGQWGHLLAEQISSVPHPFTLVPGEGDGKLQIFMKVHSGFTDKLAKACQRGLELRLKLQGPYGLPPWPLPGVARMVLVLGGVGVTPALSLAPAAAQKAEKVCIFWSLRSLALLEKAAPLLEPHLDPRSSVQIAGAGEASDRPLPLKAHRNRMDAGDWLVKLSETFPEEGVSQCQVMVFVCGPPRLVAATKAAAGRLAWHVHVEEFAFLPSSSGSSDSSMVQTQEPQVLGRRAAAVPAEEPERAKRAPEWARAEEHFVTDGNRAGSRSKSFSGLMPTADVLSVSGVQSAIQKYCYEPFPAMRLTASLFRGHKPYWRKMVQRYSSTYQPMDPTLDKCYCLELFGYAPDSTLNKQELKTAYLRLAKELHPDVSPRGQEDGASFKTLQHCYKVLLQQLDKQNEPEWLRKMREDYATSKDPFP
ncbi:unnamed protein product [Symbiodinium microadriaticum]|nr:unnamed protein product [Symbiodinium sp. KB8]CAE7892697.1 unnamed protein product [Symbiodinium microadriaticum]